MRLRAPQITSRRLLLPRPKIPQRRTRPLPRRRPPPLPFILHVPVGAKDGALAASSSPGVALDATDVATAAAASSCLDVAVGTNADGPTADVASAADDDTDVDTDVTAIGDAANTPSKKRRRSGGPARAAREAAFLASKVYDATDNL